MLKTDTEYVFVLKFLCSNYVFVQVIWVEQQIAKIRAKRDVYVYRGTPNKGPDGDVEFNDPDWEKEWYIVGTFSVYIEQQQYI